MSSTRKRSYQEGSIALVKRAKGPDVWVYRWRELQAGGTRVHRKRVIGDLNSYPTKSDAKKSIEDFRARINAQPEPSEQMTVKKLWDLFQHERFPEETVNGQSEETEVDDQALGEDDLSPTTIQNYKDNFRTYILPRWGDVLLEKVKPSDVQTWLRSLKAAKETPVTTGSTRTVRKPLAPGTKAKIRNQMSALFSFAILQDLWPQDRRNPIAAVKQSAKRQRRPDVLNVEETHALLAELADPMDRTAILTAASTALRRSEIRGLKWFDVDFDNL